MSDNEEPIAKRAVYLYINLIEIMQDSSAQHMIAAYSAHMMEETAKLIPKDTPLPATGKTELLAPLAIAYTERVLGYLMQRMREKLDVPPQTTQPTEEDVKNETDRSEA